MHRAQGRAGDRRLGFGGDPGDPEVGDPRPIRSVDDDVPGLHVAMDDAAGMGHRQAAGHVRGDPHGRPRRERCIVMDARGEVVPVNELHDEERLAAVRAGAEVPDDRGVVQDGGRMRLAPEPQREVRIGNDFGAQQLHGHRPPELRVPRPEDGGHAAPPDQLVEAVAAGKKVPRFGHARTVSGIAASRHESGPIPGWGPRDAAGFATRAPHANSRSFRSEELERETGFEPATSSLEG